MDANLTHISKLLSLVLRHEPEALGLTLDDEGYASVEDLLQALAKQGKSVSRDVLNQVVAQNDKQRFVFSADGSQIRAQQGHSINVNLKLEPVMPPELLYHGTATRFVENILSNGLERRNRQHVHLSATEDVARSVGQRHGRPAILLVASGEMARNGHDFYRSGNGVWLTPRVPVNFIKRLE